MSARKDITSPNTKALRQTLLANGRWVSTVRLGADVQAMDSVMLPVGAALGVERPLTRMSNLLGYAIETMVFLAQGNWSELDCRRYPNAEEALAEHDSICAKWEVEP